MPVLGAGLLALAGVRLLALRGGRCGPLLAAVSVAAMAGMYALLAQSGGGGAVLSRGRAPGDADVFAGSLRGNRPLIERMMEL